MINSGHRQDRNRTVRRLRSEQLEDRRLLTAGPLLHNFSMPVDVDDNGAVTPRDALVLINELNALQGGQGMAATASTEQFFMDVNNDKRFTAIDVLRVVNALNAEGEGEMVRVRVAATHDDGGNPLTNIGLNDTFTLDILVTDLTGRTSNNGVFAAYADIEYDSSLVEINGPLIQGPEYNPPSVESSNPGLLNDIGAFDGGDPLGAEELLLLSVPFAPLATGMFTFEVTPADEPGSEVLIFGSNEIVDVADVLYEGTTINVVEGTSPATTDLSYDTEEEQPVVTVFADGLLQNASDPDGDLVEAVIIRPPDNGVLMDLELSSGAFIYQPDPNFNGVDTFEYAVTDGTLLSPARTVTINVVALNDRPVGEDDLYEAAQGVPLVVSTDGGVLKNDSDVDGDSLSVAGIEQVPSNGMVQMLSNGSFTYTPDPGFQGADEFVYIVTDGELDDLATVTIEVTEDARPAASDDTYAVNEDVVLNINAADGVLANDLDPNGDTLTATIVDEPNSGDLTLMEDGSFLYTPAADFNGTDSFTYQAADAIQSSNSATVTITVNPINDVPVGETDSYAVDEDFLLEVDSPGLLSNDTDIDSTMLTVVDISSPAHGDLVHSSQGFFAYDPNDDFNGTDTFTYRVSDGDMRSDPVTVMITVNPINDAPVAVADSYSTSIGNELTVLGPDGVLKNDSDVELDNLTASLVTEAADGMVQFLADGSFTYTPDVGFSGVDSFTYVANDGSVDSEETTVSIEVDGISVESTVNIRLEATSVDGTPITSTTVGSEFNVQVLVSDIGPSPVDGVFAAFLDLLYDSDLATAGPVIQSAEFENEDPGDLSRPGLVNDFGAFNGGTPKGLGEFLLITVPFQANAAGQLDLISEPADFLPAHEVLIYNSDDPVPTSEVVYGSLTIDILDSQTGPIAQEDFYGTNENQPLIIGVDMGVLTNDSGESPLTAELVSDVSNGTLSLSPDGSFSYEPTEDFSGTDTFTYQVRDANDNVSNTAVVTIDVTAMVDNPPVAEDDIYDVAMDTLLEVSAAEGVLNNDFDLDGDVLSAALVTDGQNGTVTLEEDGSFTYTPDSGFVGTDLFTYQVTANGISSAATATINVFDPTAAASISGYAYQDSNRNGEMDGHEVTFVASKVDLVGRDVNGNSVSRTSVTDRDGMYRFQDLPAGTYTVLMPQPLFTVDGIDTADGEASPMNDRFVVELSAREAKTNYNFGERSLHPRFLGNPEFFASRSPNGMMVAIDAVGDVAWNRFELGWDGIESAHVSYDPGSSTATLTVIDVDGNELSDTFSVLGNPHVRMMGSASEGYLIRLIGTPSDFALKSTNDAAAVDAVFAQ